MMETGRLITFFDIPSTTEKKAWSLNTWRIRFILNFKGLPYKTVWLEYPNIRNALGALGMPKTGKKGTFQSVPAISDSIHQGSTEVGPPTLLADSWHIAQYLESKYPGPHTLFPHGTASLQYVLMDHLEGTLLKVPCINLMMLQTWIHLNPASQPHFRETREASLCDVNRPKLEDLCPEGPERTAVIEKLRDSFDYLDSAFPLTRGRESEAIFTLPSQMVYSDFVLGSILMWIKVLAYEELWVHIASWNDGRWRRFLEALDSKYGQVS